MGGNLQKESVISESEKIKKIQIVIQSELLDTSSGGFVRSLIETEDKRIASGGYNGNISISSYDVNETKWNIDIHKKYAHRLCITSLCNLKGNKLLSGGYDCLIKIWAVFKAEIVLIKELKDHSDLVWSVIPLSKERFASSSYDGTVKIWKDDNNKYECISTLRHNYCVRSILQLRNKEVLVSAYGRNESSYGISFWDLNKSVQQHSIKGYSAFMSAHMIELSDGNIALSSCKEPYPIIIIDNSTYQIVSVIQLKGCTNEYFSSSSLCAFNEHSFIYAHHGTFLQISNKDYLILFQSNKEKFDGYDGIIKLEGGKYFAFNYDNKIIIVRPCYD